MPNSYAYDFQKFLCNLFVVKCKIDWSQRT